MKTVIRKEKVLFHPPWAIPAFPPLALPTARRLRKSSVREFSEEKKRMKNYRKARRQVSLITDKSKVLQRILLPLINTLKVAAKNKVANGASPEEASKYLTTIIQYAKNSIVQALFKADKSNHQDIPTIKNEDRNISTILTDPKKDKVKRIPIFNVASVKQLQNKMLSSNNDSVPVAALNSSKPALKLEIEPSLISESSPTSESTDIKKSSANNFQINEGRRTPSPINPNSIQSSSMSTVELTRTDSNNITALNGNIGNIINNPDIQLVSEIVVPKKEKVDEPNLMSIPIEPKKESIPARVPLLMPLANVKADNLITKEVVHLNNANTGLIKLENPNQHNIPAKNSNNMADMVESLVKQQLTASSNDDNTALPLNLSNMITSTITGLIPTLAEDNNDDNDDDEEGFNYSRKRQKVFDPNKVLNLDGLVPPMFHGSKMTSKALSSSPGSIKPRKIKEKSESNNVLYSFNIPDYKNVPGKKNYIMKLAKKYLDNDQLISLKRSVNNERKRKWREANATKNWLHDLRSRLKKNANAQFGESDSLEKMQWLEATFKRKKIERGITDDFETKKEANEGTAATFISDDEILNMIATELDRLDLARLIEKEMNEDYTKLYHPGLPRKIAGK